MHTAEQFEILWKSRFPEAPPISHVLKHIYPNEWLRLHSLPGSKRYADTKEEWTILLNRQNAIINDILKDRLPNIGLVYGEYFHADAANAHQPMEIEVATKIPWIQLPEIEIQPWGYDPGMRYRPLLHLTTWEPGKFDAILRAVADDELRVLFVPLHTTAIIAPYDGGVDIILENTIVRDQYMTKYRDWLSDREDGF